MSTIRCAKKIILILNDYENYTADRWRAILTGEQPDYIHAVNINVCSYN